jgi:hypothetical protein
MTQDSVPTPDSSMPQARPGASFGHRLIQLARKPRILLLLLAGWSFLGVLAQVFVNNGVFLDIHDIEMDGALGGFALGFNSAPLVLLYLYCWRDPDHYRSVFWLALLQQVAMACGVVYQLIIGTFSIESIAVPLAGSVVLAVLSFLELFQPKTKQQ